MMRLIDETVDTFRHFCSRNSCENQCRAHAGLGEMQTVKPSAASLWRPACAYRVELRFLGPSAACSTELSYCSRQLRALSAYRLDDNSWVRRPAIKTNNGNITLRF